MVTRLERRVCPHAVSGKMFWLCAITYIIALFGRMSYSAVMVALIANGSMDEAQAGLIGTALFIVYGVSQIFSGLIGDRISPKKMIFVGLIGSGILNLIMGLTGQYAVMLVVWALNGLFQSTMWSPIARIFAEQMPPDERKKCCNNIAVTYPLATILAYVLATVLLTAWNWRGVFLLAGGMIIITGINWMIRMSWFEKQIETSDEIEVIELQPKQTQKKENMLRLLLLSGIVLAALLMSIVPLVELMPGLLTDADSLEIRTFLERALDIVIGIEFIKMLAKHSPGSVLEVLLYAIARHMIVGHEDAVQNLVSVGAIALIFIIRKYFFVPSFGYKMPGGKIAPDMEQKDAETPEAKAGDMAE